ncbi:MAG: MSCRAMM family protein [Janthinobacterium lividum]
MNAYKLDATAVPPELLSAHLGTSICSGTQPELSAGVILSELRTAVARGRQPDLHGTVTVTAGKDIYDRRPLPGVGVAIVSAGDHARFHAIVDDDGRYAFDTLPAGTYSAAFDLPAHTVLLFSEDKQLSVVIPPNDGTGLACHLNVVVGPSGGIRGHVIDQEGRAAEGTVFAYPKGGYRPEVRTSFSADVHKGAFLLGNIPDGEYKLVFNNYGSKLHGTTQASVHEGEVTSGVEIHLK